MSIFEKKSTMPVGADELYRWHARPGAFERLVPPWDPVDLVSHEGGIEDGARRVMKIHPGPLSLTWEALHRDHIEGRQFVDEQLRGPFSSWVHTHRFEPREDSDTSILSEHIEYSLPLGPLGNAVGGASTRKMLEQLFDFRHRRTADDLNRHRTTDRQLKVAITGASGLIGSALSAFLTTGGHEVLRLVRRPEDLEEDEVYWSPAKSEIDAESLEGLDAVVHLAGESVNGRWSPEKRRQIEESRTRGTALLAETLSRLERPPAVFASASGVGFYGECADRELREDAPAGDNFLAQVCTKWEAATEPAREAGIRTLKLRIGVVLDPRSGALKEMLPAVRLGLARRLGSGDQYVSWIDLDDLIAAIHFLLINDELEGPFNLTAPRPVKNSELFDVLGDVVGRPTIIPVPQTFIKLMVGSQMAQETALASQRAFPGKLLDAGFPFYYDDLQSSLAHKLGARSGQS